MPVYNDETYVSLAINSILEQTYQDYELIIIDDGSTDNSLKVIKSYRDPRIRVIKNKINQKLPTTLNTGIEVAKGEYIARMDANDISYKDRFALQIEFMEKHTDIGVCGTNFRTVDESGNVLLDKLWKKSNHPLEWDLLWENPIGHTTVMLRMSIIDKYNFRYRKIYAEDGDLWCRMATRTRLGRINKVLMDVLIQKDSESVNNRKLHMEQAVKSSFKYVKWLTEKPVPNFYNNFLIYSKVIGKNNIPMPNNNLVQEWFWDLENSINSKFNLSDRDKIFIKKDILKRNVEYFEDQILKLKEQINLKDQKINSENDYYIALNNEIQNNYNLLKSNYDNLKSGYDSLLDSRSYKIAKRMRDLYRIFK